MMSVSKLISEGRKLLDAGKYDEAIKKLNKALKNIPDKTKDIQNQVDALFWLGQCYFKQAIKTSDARQADERFDQAIKQFKESLNLAEKLDGQDGIQEQVYAQHWLGHCYMEQAIKASDARQADQRFEQAIEHFKGELDLAGKLEGQNGIQQHVYAQYWLGRCYMQQAIKTSDARQADERFDQAIKQFKESLNLAGKLDGQDGIQQHVYAQYWLGRCYMQQAIKTSDARQADERFDQAIKQFTESLNLAGKLDGQDGIQQQVYAQSWLGGCYFEQASKISDARQADQRFGQAIRHLKETLDLAAQLEDPNGIQQQVYAQKSLGYFLLEKNKKSKTVRENKNTIKNYFEQAKILCEKLLDETSKEEQITSIRRYEKELDFLAGDYNAYFDAKKEDIQKHLKLNSDLKEPVSSILAVLSIAPVEFNKPLAHYTKPFVCEKLLGIKQKEKDQPKIADKMRMNSSTYMNDPYEGKSLLDFCGIQDISLENKTEFSPHNAFFTCFSARVNDLNQFRLYGKVNDIEASGCCLVFNKRGNWVKEPDISASYPRLNDKNSFDNQETIKDTTTTQRPSEDLPLYQVAYIFYRDEYTKQDEYDVFGDIPEEKKPSFGIRLKPISNDKEWHNERKKQFEKALSSLFDYFNPNTIQANDEKQTNDEKEEQQIVSAYEKTEEQKQADQYALEYIRYLFKDYAFRDEEEFRLLQIEELGSEKVQYCHETNSAYVEYADICNKLDEVILGTNYERAGGEQKVEAFRYLLKKKLPHIKVSHSSLPINAALPARKP
ncbi:tetratricopeptide repeat protein [Neisseria dumasiana]|uniref:tetratricopeptide repeat protein n=1 Tax=Neisseria dumasiana TaxID=1931275 RepID=UPI001FD3409D|nr:tetratricopeptide repeat protein [Neisseria dumasiana]UOO84691.1 tetratricopeptide repeat protein [Neisseria dumasiana]